MPVPDQLYDNVVQFLQAQPNYYRHFGPDWWRFKRLLKQAGYSRAQFHGLGDNFPDPLAEAATAELSDEEFVQTALARQRENAELRFMLPHQPSFDNDGAAYYLVDSDVE